MTGMRLLSQMQHWSGMLPPPILALASLKPLERSAELEKQGLGLLFRYPGPRFPYWGYTDPALTVVVEPHGTPWFSHRPQIPPAPR
jgi:hypothetical protein